MYEAGARTFIEAGPGKVLSGLATAILDGKPVQIVPMDVPGRNGVVHLEHALAQLAVAGLSYQAWCLFEGRVRQKLHLDRLVKDAPGAALSHHVDHSRWPRNSTEWTAHASKARAAPERTAGTATAGDGESSRDVARKDQRSGLPKYVVGQRSFWKR